MLSYEPNPVEAKPLKKIIAALFIVALSAQVQAGEICKVQVCNKIERFSLNPMSHIRDSIGESCADVIVPKEEAIVGRQISTESRWYQGSFNPTKESVTRVKQVYQCKEVNFN